MLKHGDMWTWQVSFNWNSATIQERRPFLTAHLDVRRQFKSGNLSRAASDQEKTVVECLLHINRKLSFVGMNAVWN